MGDVAFRSLDVVSVGRLRRVHEVFTPRSEESSGLPVASVVRRAARPRDGGFEIGAVVEIDDVTGHGHLPLSAAGLIREGAVLLFRVCGLLAYDEWPTCFLGASDRRGDVGQNLLDRSRIDLFRNAPLRRPYSTCRGADALGSRSPIRPWGREPRHRIDEPPGGRPRSRCSGNAGSPRSSRKRRSSRSLVWSKTWIETPSSSTSDCMSAGTFFPNFSRASSPNSASMMSSFSNRYSTPKLKRASREELRVRHDGWDWKDFVSSGHDRGDLLQEIATGQ